MKQTDQTQPVVNCRHLKYQWQRETDKYHCVWCGRVRVLDPLSPVTEIHDIK